MADEMKNFRWMKLAITIALAVLIPFSVVDAKAACFENNVSPETCAILCAENSHRILSGRNSDIPLKPPQMTSQESHKMPPMAMDASPATKLLMAEASGTSLNPMSVGMPMRMKKMTGSWSLMFMADGFITDTQQSGPRGADKFYSTNVFMGSAEHAAGPGSFLFDAMMSLEPATVSDRQYPLLFQTGETAFGKPIEDGQHPHDLIMALGLHYARSAGKNTIIEAYFAPVGDPALGPVAFPHRDSAAEIPQAPIGHHWEDSTHIANEVATVGVKHKSVRLELSGFHGAEPDENRWNIDAGAIDSWAARFSLVPSSNWTAQVSVGRLTKPEALEPGDVVRTTASVAYSRPLGGSNWSTSFIFGRNHKTVTGRGTNAFLLESLIPFRQKNFFIGRWELVDKDELFAAQPAIQQQLAATVGTTFRIGEYTIGYTRYVRLVAPLDTGFGANFSAYTLPAAITPFYGDHAFGVNLYLHFRLRQKNQ
ncbi:MAG TPA: hypothetical protein VGR72_09255 [Candidatus Acidoferrales bacterium]|nr:hypothetical protein [Candidatus Acidoferrales bacterium]